MTDFDLAITNGTVVDGTGQPRFRADLGIRDGKIAAVAAGESLTGRCVIDAAGLVIAPGFIDVHSHADWVLPLTDHEDTLAPLLLQGITTVVAGQCGFSPAPVTNESSESLRDEIGYRWRSMGEYIDTLAGNGLLLNAAFLVGHGALRYAAMGERANVSGPPTSRDIQEMRSLARMALREGAIGLSAGLAYTPGVFARGEELLSLLEIVSDEGAVFTVHGRAYSWVSSLYTPMIGGTAHNVRSTRELLDLARRARVRLQLSHLIFVGRHTWRTHRAVLDDVEQAADGGLDVAFDAFPYTVGNSTVKVILPEWFLDGFDQNIQDQRALRRLGREIFILRHALGIGFADLVLLLGYAPELEALKGLDFGTIARRLGLSQLDAYMHVARVSQGRARILLGTYSGDERREEPLWATLSHPLCAFMTDTILTRRGPHNPASFGTFPRVLGRYSRDLGLFSLEEAVHRMTGFPAKRMGLKGTGRIEEGAWADLVILDADVVADKTTLQRADAPPTGIKSVLVSGQVAAENGQRVNRKRYGRVLRR